MIRRLRVTLLVDNVVGGAGGLAEHGLSLWVEADERRLLFDAGAGEVLTKNARRLGADVFSADAAVLSHGHYDHAGGFELVPSCAHRLPVYLHPDALRRRYSCHKGKPPREIGVAPHTAARLRGGAAEPRWTREPTRIFDDVFVTGEIPRRAEVEGAGGGDFFLDEAGTQPDPLNDEQALYLESARGLVVLIGCAHPGVINTLDYVAELTGRREIYAVVGGLHLRRTSEERLEAVAEELARREVKVIGPAHCTGSAATAFLRQRFPSRCVECAVGTQFEFA